MLKNPNINSYLALTITFFLLSSCAQKCSSTSKTDTASNTNAEITLSMWEHERDDIQKVLDHVSADFTAENPNIKITRAHYKTEDLRTQYQTAALGGGGGDIVFAPNDFAGPLALMNVIMSVENFVQPERFFSEVIESVRDPAGSKIWGLPISRGNHLMLMVNKHFVPEPIQTIEALVAAAKRNTKDKVYGLAFNLNEPFFFAPFVSAFGGRLIIDQKPNLNTPAMVEALKFVHKLKFENKVVPQDCDYTCAETLFIEGKAAMIINGDWAVQQYTEVLKENLAIYPLPKSETSGHWMEPMASGKFLFFNSNLKGEKLEAAKKWGEFLVSPKVQLEFAKGAGKLPSLLSLANAPEVTGNPGLHASQLALVHAQPMPMNVTMRAIWDAIRPQLQNLMADRKTAEAAAVAMQNDAEVKIKEMQQ